MTEPETIQIPGPFTFFRTYDVPPLDVRIPLVAHTRPTLWIVQGTIIGLIGMTVSLLPIVLGIAVHTGSVLFTPPEVVGASLCVNAFALYLMSLTFICAREAVNREPILRVDAVGFHDYRGNVVVPWDQIRAMRAEHSRWGTVGIALAVKHRIASRPVKLPIPRRAIWQRPGNEWRVFVSRLDVRQYVIEHAAAHFIREHGGSAETRRWD